jgi:hypothetical protein
VFGTLLNKALKAGQRLRQIGFAILQVKEGGMVSEEKGHGGRIIFVQDRNPSEPNYVTREQMEEFLCRAAQMGKRSDHSGNKKPPSK